MQPRMIADWLEVQKCCIWMSTELYISSSDGERKGTRVCSKEYGNVAVSGSKQASTANGNL